MKISCVDVVESKQDLADVLGVVDVLVGFSHVLCVEHTIHDGIEVSRLDAFDDAIQLLLHDGFVGPRAHVHTENATVSAHQAKCVKLGCLSPCKQGLER